MQCDQSKPSESRSVALGGAVGELPKACMKARALIPGTEVDPHRESQSLLFAKRPVESYRQKVAGDRNKPSLLSQRLKEEALRVPSESARELTTQQGAPSVSRGRPCASWTSHARLVTDLHPISGDGVQIHHQPRPLEGSAVRAASLPAGQR